MMDLRVQGVKERVAPEGGADVHILLEWIRSTSVRVMA